MPAAYAKSAPLAFVFAVLSCALQAQTAPPSVNTARASIAYLKAYEIAETGSRPAALRLLAESLRLDAHANPAAQLAFSLLIEQRAPSPVQLLGQQGVFSSAVFSLDGRKILTTASDHTARLWDAHTGAPLVAPMQLDDNLVAAALSPDGRFLAVGTEEGEVVEWDAKSGKQEPAEMKLTASAWSVAFSPDSSMLAAATENGHVRCWNAVDGKPLAPEMVYRQEAYRVSFSPDSRYLLLPVSDGFTDVRDARTGASRFRLKAGGTPLYAQYRPGSNVIAVAGNDPVVRFWDAETGKLTGVTLAHGSGVASLGFSADGRSIVTASRDHTARVWDAQTGRPLTPPLQHPAPVSRAAFSPDARLVLTIAGDKAVRVWDASTGDAVRLPIFFPNVAFAAFNPASPSMLVAGGAFGSILDLAPGEDAPAWLPELADFAATLNNFDQSVPTDLTEAEALKHRLQSSTANDPWTKFGKWYFADVTARPISPWSDLTLQAYVDLLIARADAPSLDYAQSLSRPFPSWLAKVEAARAKLPKQKP